MATQTIRPPSTVSVVTLTHNGRSNFVVWVYRGSEKDLLVNEIGVYRGSRPLLGSESVTFDIDADGAWSIQITPIGSASSPAFTGRGDAVSGLFTPSTSGAWNISHVGQSNFVVWLHCAGGDDLVQNEIGPVTASRVVQFSRGPCFWEVEADGNWSLAPR